MSQLLREFSVALRTLDPSDPDLSDLEPLRNLVGQARVVSIGESAHCALEFYQLKDRLLRFLVSELGFTAFVMESGFAEGVAVNDWVLGGEGDLEQVANTGITYRFGECEEMRAQLRWMREWNRTHDRQVRFYGMDVPGSCANSGSAVKVCLARLNPRPGDAEFLRLADLGECFTALARYAAMEPADREYLSRGIADLSDRARAAKDEIALRSALGAQCLVGLLADGSVSEMKRKEGCNPRDEFMAENVRWILEREARIVIGAHNGHIQRASLFGSPMLGQFLAPELGKDMVVIGTTFAGGQIVDLRPGSQPGRFATGLEESGPPPPHTIDALMESARSAAHLVDLRRVPTETLRSVTAMRLQTVTVELEAKQAFDALIHVPRITPVPGAFEALRNSIASANS